MRSLDEDRSQPLRLYPASSNIVPMPPTLLWLHGGGFFRGNLDLPEADNVAKTVARLGVTVTTTTYRLAPIPGFAWAHPRSQTSRGQFPLALDDVTKAYQKVRASSPSGVVIGGASAGACLAAAATLRALDDGTPPLGVVLAYGFFHANHPPTQHRKQRSRKHRRFTHARWALDLANRNYAGSPDALKHRLAFPGGHNLAGFPRTLVINAETDNMRASGDLFAAELRAADVDVQRHVLSVTTHAFLNHPERPAFTTATSLIAKWIGAIAVR